MYWKLIFVSVLFSSVLAEEYNFEFGVNIGEVIYDKDGTIGILSHHTDVNIPVPSNKKITYVKVTVWALAPPKVNHEESLNRITIHYSWLEVPTSKYRIIAKAVDN